MKTQINNSRKAAIAITFLVTLFVFAACNERKQSAGDNTVAQNKAKPPKTDIHTAVLTGDREALKQHISAGTNINEKDPLGGSSPLISACLFGKTEMVKLLVEAGADLNFRNNDGSTALHTASFFCRSEIVRMLLDHGANKTIKNKYGQTAYELVSGPFAAIEKSYTGLGKMLEPMGLKLDYAYLEKTRPEIAAMLK